MIILKKYFVLSILFTIFSYFLIYPGTQSKIEEYSLKAIYIKKFNDYIEWPDCKTKNESNKYFKIGVIGKAPIFKTLKQVYKDNKLFNKDVKVIKTKDKANLSSFNILFVSNLNKTKISKIIKIAKKNNILLIGDTPGFALSGIHINFYIKDGKLKFRINRKSLLSAGLSASSSLLSLAEIVTSRGESQ